jgi:ribosomal protein S27AE
MTDIQRIQTDSSETHRPPCPKCGAPMWLTRIEPDHPGVDRRTFECARCEHNETMLVSFT